MWKTVLIPNSAPHPFHYEKGSGQWNQDKMKSFQGKQSDGSRAVDSSKILTSAEHFATAAANFSTGRVRPGIVGNSKGPRRGQEEALEERNTGWTPMEQMCRNQVHVSIHYDRSLTLCWIG